MGCTTSNQTSSTDDDPEVTSYTAAQISEHDSESDCWMAVGSTVYDATPYISEHPPGADSIVNGCGQVYTIESFEDINPHKNVSELLEPLYIGELAQ